METTTIKEILIKKGVKPSLHRMKVLEYLMDKKNHPTVDRIYRDISPDIPTLSKTTVYNTLKTFHENSVVQVLTIEENEVRYDADISAHAHFKCNVCGMVYDVEANYSSLPERMVMGHRINETQVFFFGTCKNCLK